MSKLLMKPDHCQAAVVHSKTNFPFGTLTFTAGLRELKFLEAKRRTRGEYTLA